MIIFKTSECVSEGHPDKVCDAISDSILDACLAVDPKARVACESLIKGNQVVLAGELTTSLSSLDIKAAARTAIAKCGYANDINGFGSQTCEITSIIDRQSPEIARAVTENDGAGDQGIMCGYATNETPTFMPMPTYLARTLIDTLRLWRTTGKLKDVLLPDAKTQVTVAYVLDENTQEPVKPVAVETVVLSTHHVPMPVEELRALLKPLIEDWQKSVDPTCHGLFNADTTYLINPAGAWTVGGPAADAGVTGRKLVVDNFGPNIPVGGGAFSGKDPTKVDRTGAYMARYVAKNLVMDGYCDSAFVQVSYAIGKKDPTSYTVKMTGSTVVDGRLGYRINRAHRYISFCPQDIINLFDLRRPIYMDTAIGGHFGRMSLPWEARWNSPIK